MTPGEAAALLRQARTTQRTLEPFTDLHEVDEDWAYAVQDVDLAERLARGERQIGVKLGLTSRAKQERMGVDRAIVGFLTDDMLVDADDVSAALSRWAQPRIEPEIAFVTDREIGRALTDDEVPAHVRGVLMAAEVIDSRWAGYRFGLPDVVADNTSAAGVVLAEDTVPMATFDDVEELATLACRVDVDGHLVHEATGAAILGQPLRALRVLSEHLERRGRTLPAGSLVLAGALTDAVPLEHGYHYRLIVERLGSVTVTT